MFFPFYCKTTVMQLGQCTLVSLTIDKIPPTFRDQMNSVIFADLPKSPVTLLRWDHSWSTVRRA